MDSKNKKYKILLTGGGTGGSVAPLLAVAEELASPQTPALISPLVRGITGEGEEGKITPTPLCKEGKYEFLWLGTKFGPEQAMVEKAEIKFRAICGGKWRRYFSFKNLADIFNIKLGFLEALFIMFKWRPDLVMSAGSFISVPVVWAAWILRVPVLIHQQDVQPGLANKLMASFAKVITVTFEKSLKDYGKKAVWIGNPVRKEIRNLKFEIGELRKKYGINNQLPLVLIVGGGTGAEAINKLASENLNELTKFCQIIHITGKSKGIRNQESGIRNYFAYEFLDAERIVGALKLADVAVTRAGLGFLTELSYLEKPAIIIPIPDSHQLENAAMFKEAAIVLEQQDLTAAKFTAEIKNLIDNKNLQKELGEKMGRVMKSGANEAIVKIICKIINRI